MIGLQHDFGAYRVLLGHYSIFYILYFLIKQKNQINIDMVSQSETNPTYSGRLKDIFDRLPFIF